MARYSVYVTRTIEMVIPDVRAKSEEAAMTKVDAMTEETLLRSAEVVGVSFESTEAAEEY